MLFHGEDLGLTPQQQEVYATMSKEQRKKLRDFADRYKGNLERNRNLYSNFIHSVFAKAILEQQMMMEEAGSGYQEMDPEM